LKTKPVWQTLVGKLKIILAAAHGAIQLASYRALAITSQKHVTKHFRIAKKYCAQWQLNLCAIFTGSTQHDNCAIATVNIIKT